MATNKVYTAPPALSVVCSDPTTPASGDPVRFGTLTGVAIQDESEGGNATGYTTIDFSGSAWNLSVKGIDGSGNSAVAAGDALFYVDADTPKLSKKATGYFFGFALEAVVSGATTTIKVLHTPSPGAGTLGTGTVSTTQLAANAVTAAKLSSTLVKGFVPLDITAARIISANAIQNTTEAGVPDGNTSPSLARVNGATDKALRLIWAASSSEEIQFSPIAKPPDLDDASDLTIHLMIAKDTNTDNTAVCAVSVWDGVGDTNAGGNTAALSTASLTEYTVTLAAADLAAAPGFLNISLTPGTHTTDAIRLYAAWIEYTRA